MSRRCIGSLSRSSARAAQGVSQQLQAHVRAAHTSATAGAAWRHGGIATSTAAAAPASAAAAVATGLVRPASHVSPHRAPLATFATVAAPAVSSTGAASPSSASSLWRARAARHAARVPLLRASLTGSAYARAMATTVVGAEDAEAAAAPAAGGDAAGEDTVALAQEWAALNRRGMDALREAMAVAAAPEPVDEEAEVDAAATREEAAASAERRAELLDEAERLFREAAAFASRHAGTYLAPFRSLSLANLGSVLVRKGHAADAARIFTPLVAELQRHAQGGPVSPAQLATVHLEFAAALEVLGGPENITSAVAQLERAAQVFLAAAESAAEQLALACPLDQLPGLLAAAAAPAVPPAVSAQVAEVLHHGSNGATAFTSSLGARFRGAVVLHSRMAAKLSSRKAREQLLSLSVEYRALLDILAAQLAAPAGQPLAVAAVPASSSLSLGLVRTLVPYLAAQPRATLEALQARASVDITQTLMSLAAVEVDLLMVEAACDTYQELGRFVLEHSPRNLMPVLGEASRTLRAVAQLLLPKNARMPGRGESLESVALAAVRERKTQPAPAAGAGAGAGAGDEEEAIVFTKKPKAAAAGAAAGETKDVALAQLRKLDETRAAFGQLFAVHARREEKAREDAMARAEAATDSLPEEARRALQESAEALRRAMAGEGGDVEAALRALDPANAANGNKKQ